MCRIFRRGCPVNKGTHLSVRLLFVKYNSCNILLVSSERVAGGRVSSLFADAFRNLRLQRQNAGSPLIRQSCSSAPSVMQTSMSRPRWEVGLETKGQVLSSGSSGEQCMDPRPTHHNLLCGHDSYLDLNTKSSHLYRNAKIAGNASFNSW